MTRRGNVVVAVMVALGLAGCDYDKANSPTGMYDSAPRSRFQVVTASGDLTNALTEFRALLGDPANGATPGPLGAGAAGDQVGRCAGQSDQHRRAAARQLPAERASLRQSRQLGSG